MGVPSAMDPDATKISPGFMRNALTTWHEGMPAAPQSKPSYYNFAPKRAHMQERTRSGYSNFYLTLSQASLVGVRQPRQLRGSH